MVPVIELRGGLPYGITLGLPYPVALLAAVLGNMIPVPFIILFIRRIFAWMRKHSKRWDGIGLCILVAIPLPGTGAWTGALVAAVLDMRLKKAVPAIFLGVCIAAAIMTAVTFGLIHMI